MSRLAVAGAIVLLGAGLGAIGWLRGSADDATPPPVTNTDKPHLLAPGAPPPQTMVRADWDGTSPFTCGGTDQFLIEDVSSDNVGGGAPIMAAGNCHLKLVGVHLKGLVTLTAGGNALVEVESSSLTGTKLSLSAVGHATVVLKDSSVDGPVEKLGDARIVGLPQPPPGAHPTGYLFSKPEESFRSFLNQIRIARC